jgi:hypothetical protein
MSFEKKLNEMGYSIEPIPPNNGKIVPAVRTGNLIYTSGVSGTSHLMMSMLT